MRRWLALVVVLVALATAVGSLAYMASAADTATTLSGGDTLTVNCDGGGRLSQQRLSRTSIRDTCGGGTTTTTAGTTTTTSDTTTTTTTTTMPPTTTTGGGGGGGGGGLTNCTSDPQGNLGAFSYSGITNSNGFNTYVSNNMWGAQAGTTATVCAGDPGNWTLTTRTTQDQGGAVQTYPDVQQLTNNWNGSGWGGNAGSQDVPYHQLSSLTSSFNITNPPTNQGAWWAAYDIWSSSGELMIVTTGSDFRLANNGATVRNPDVVIGGQHYTEMYYGGFPNGLPQMVLHGNPTSGTVDIQAVMNYWASQGVISTGATIGQLDYGWEICDTGGATLNFKVNGYSLTMAP